MDWGVHSPNIAKARSNKGYDLQNLESSTEDDGADMETKLIKSIVEDDKAQLITLSRLLFGQDKGSLIDRPVVSKLLGLCFVFDSIECATSLVNGELGAVPLLNGIDSEGMSPLHAAASAHAARCVGLLLRKHARTDLRTRDGRRLLPLELSLLSARTDVIWNPDDYSIEHLIVQLSEKDLTTVKFLSEKTKEIDEVAYASAIGGRVVDLAILLAVAAEKINESILELHESDFNSKEKVTVYECVIREALALGRPDKSLKTAKRNCAPTESESAQKRKLLLCEIELLQVFGAVGRTDFTDKKVTSPLLRASQAGDEAVVDLLLKTDMDIDGVDAEGNSALHWCLKPSKGSCPQRIKIMLLLLEYGARVSQKNKLGLNVVHIAAANGDLQALQILLLKDPDCVNFKTEVKETPLFLAVKNGHKDCAQVLLRCGASTEIFNLRRQRPIDVAESQDMRFMLNTTNISHTKHALPFQQKYVACLQGDEVISETCKDLFTSTDENRATDSSCLGSKPQICKYFRSSSGCVRGTNCFYVHAEEEAGKRKQGTEATHFPVFGNFKRKIFVGGLPPSVDSDSLGKYFEKKFGPVEDAVVVGSQTGDKIQSRGFGFVTFKHKNSVSAAVEANYVTIRGKQVEIKSAVPKCVLLTEFQKFPQQHEQEQSYQLLQQEQMLSLRTPSEKMEHLSSCSTPCGKTEMGNTICKTSEEANSELMSWVYTLIRDQPEAYSNGFQTDTTSMPAWFRIFKKWFPSFLQKISQKNEEYALSSLKADFRSAFRMELDHASLGYSKLSEFIKSMDDLCHVKYVPIGRQQLSNHMILLPVSVEIPDDNSVNSRFLQFLSPDPIFRGPPLELNPSTQRKHFVLEALARKKNKSTLFLREFDFHENYKANVNQKKCFWCNNGQMVWANFPCQHMLWCTACKELAMQAAHGTKEHLCVVCDIKVERIQLISWPVNNRSSIDTTCINEFPPFDPDYLRNRSKKKR